MSNRIWKYKEELIDSLQLLTASRCDDMEVTISKDSIVYYASNDTVTNIIVMFHSIENLFKNYECDPDFVLSIQDLAEDSLVNYDNQVIHYVF